MPDIFSKYILEIACFEAKSCLLAEQAGADRIEFCADYEAGGITPAYEDILHVKKTLKIPLHVIIRPRSGNFVYTEKEIDIMRQLIWWCKENKVNGVVFGILNPDNSVNFEANKQLLELAKPMSVTFHRAIDQCRDIKKGFETIIELGFDKVLTSGGQQNALEGIEFLQHLQKQFGNKITIIPGGGIRSFNIEKLLGVINCFEFHSAATVNNEINTEEIQRLKHIIRNE
ncbi:MAG: copper homeostasis protein CutC [Bacteroidota bacterium]